MKITLIIPIHKLDVEPSLIQTMFESLSKQDDKNFNILIASFDKYRQEISKHNIYDVKYDYLSLPDELQDIYPNYTEIVNFAVHTINTSYFSVLQYDDALNNSFVKNASIYSEAYPTVSVFLPIVLEFEGDAFVRSVNEAVWNIDYTVKQGFLDFDTLKKMNIFSFVGAIFKTDDFLLNNGFKHTVKIFFEYEYFLRILYKMAEVMVIPKFMVKHTINRANSLTSYYENIDKLEGKFYLDLSRKEYFFDEDRQIVYTPIQST